MEGPFTTDDIERFVADGFLRLDRAFPPELAARCRDRLWLDLPCDRDDPTTWTEPVVRLWGYADRPFVEAANTPRVRAAFDQLVGPGRWFPKTGLGTFPIRFPSTADPGDAGWHVDGSFERDGAYWLNVASRGRALLLLFLLSDVGPDDAPTRIRRGSHLLVPPVLAPFGAEGVSFAAATPAPAALDDLAVVHATGQAGDVYLCHPFLVHAATFPHRGTRPRFIAQPALDPVGELVIDGRSGHHESPVETAIRLGLAAGAGPHRT